MAIRILEHSGILLKRQYMDPIKLTSTKLADRIHVSRSTISKLVNGRSSITANIALRLGKAFSTDPELWLDAQIDFDIQYARLHTDLDSIKPIYSLSEVLVS